MGSVREDLASWMRKLEQERDELRLKLNLAKADARDEWERLEKKWQQLRGKSDQIKEVMDETAKEVGSAAVYTAREIHRGYERLRKLM